LKNKKNHNLNDFIQEWNKKRGDIAVDVPAGSDAITVTTIHKSKGLEYPVVIVPFADWQIQNIKSNIWINTENITLPLREELKPPYLLARMSSSEHIDIKAQQEAEISKNTLESLNLLYVAFTRAVNQLYVITKSKGSKGSVSSWINRFFENLKDTHPEYAQKMLTINHEHYRFGNFDMNKYQKHHKQSKKSFILKNMKTIRLRRKLK
jgi:ATP-dependent exoDNAse (exonuclease V) beta subunit